MTTAEKNNANYGSVQADPLIAEAMVEVTAPATLKEGYKFTAVYQGVNFSVIVPKGGCTEGQRLIVPFKADDTTGKWKDDIMGCTRYGIFHPSFILGFCCKPILLGQILTRIKLDWQGNPGGDWKRSFRIMVYILIGYSILDLLLSPSNIKEEQESPMFNFVSLVFSFFMIYVVMKARRTIRERDQIPEEHCIGFEDLACAACCHCCTISQMARQTANYDEEEGHFFTPDGLPPPLAPVITV